MVDGAKIWSTDSNAFAKKDSLDENAKSTLAFAIQVSNAKTEDHAKIWSTTTNVSASQDLLENFVKRVNIKDCFVFIFTFLVKNGFFLVTKYFYVILFFIYYFYIFQYLLQVFYKL